MKKVIAVTFIGLVATTAMASNGTLNYDKMIILDAEALSETGIKDAYENIKPILEHHVVKPAEVIDEIHNELPSYRVSCSGITYDIYSPTLPNSHGEAWGRATYALFSIINSQLKDSSVKFYAINGGNELGGIFLTNKEVNEAKKNLMKKTDWPYLPTLEHPWYGLPH